MDSEWFDRVTRLVADRGWTRRGGAKLFAGAALAALLGRDAEEASAACRKVGKPCSRSRQCCGTAGTVTCRRSRCRCAGGQFKDCDGDGRCEDLGFDNANCGACGNPCPQGRTCFGSTCCVPVGGFCAAPGDCCTGVCDGVGTCQLP